MASSPFLANAVVEHHLIQLVENSEDENEVEAAELLLKSMYVDDILAVVESIQKGIKMAATISKIFKDMGMKATKYASNSSEVLATIPHEDLAPTTEKEFPSSPGSPELISKTTKVVGMSYDPERDVFTFKPYAKLLEKPIPMTKRGVSSIIPSIYDCSGHIAPYILKGKSILSRIWAYEKPVSPKLEEVTSHDKAEILLSQFEESERSPDTGKHPGYGSGGGSDEGEVDDSNNDSVHYQYKESEASYEENPSDPNMKSGDHDPSHVDKNCSGDCSTHSDVKPRSPDPNMKPDDDDSNDDSVHYQHQESHADGRKSPDMNQSEIPGPDETNSGQFNDFKDDPRYDHGSTDGSGGGSAKDFKANFKD